jgi:hypothetical protein
MPVHNQLRIFYAANARYHNVCIRELDANAFKLLVRLQSVSLCCFIRLLNNTMAGTSTLRSFLVIRPINISMMQAFPEDIRSHIPNTEGYGFDWSKSNWQVEPSVYHQSDLLHVEPHQMSFGRFYMCCFGFP